MFRNKSNAITKTVLGAAGALACAGLMSAGAVVGGTITVSGSEWNHATTATNGPAGSGATVVTTGSISTPLALSYGAYASNGGSDSASAGYSTSNGGSAELAVSDSAYWTSSYVGLGSTSFGDLRNTTMTFSVLSNSSNNSSAHPYAILSLTDGTDYYDVINMETGSGAYSITGSSSVSIWNSSAGAWVTGNGSGTNYDLSTIYNTIDPNASNLTYGDLIVTLATANIGSFGSSGINETAYIGSMSVTTPEPTSLALLGIAAVGAILLLPRQNRRAHV